MRSRSRCIPGLALLAFLAVAAPSRSFADPGPAPAPDESQNAEAEGSLRRYWRDHGVHLLVALGADQFTKLYNESMGPSANPVLFSVPPEFDARIRRAVVGPREPRGYIENSGLETLKFGAPLVLVGLDLGEGRLMAQDLTGYLELFLMKRAIVRFAKDLIGRERPNFEFAEEDGHGPKKIAELDDRERNHRSFPSGHASGAFAFATYLDRAIAREAGPRSFTRYASLSGLYGLAGYISWSRIRRDKHYFTDVAAGAAVGIGLGRYYYRINHPDEYRKGRARRQGPRRIAFNPPVPIPGGLLMTLSVNLERPRPPSNRW